MIDFEEIKKHFPQYLSAQEQKNLLKELESFPDNIDKRLYSEHARIGGGVLQGDGILGVLCVNMPDSRMDRAPVMIFSNSCDIDKINSREYYTPRVVYAPIMRFHKYRDMLVKKLVNTKRKSVEAIEVHLEEIRRQRVTNVFYLPGECLLKDDSLVFMDRMNNMAIDYFYEEKLDKKKIFSLSDYGFYLFLFKLSVHFTRVRESVKRPA